MRKLRTNVIASILSASLIFTTGIPAFADEAAETPAAGGSAVENTAEMQSAEKNGSGAASGGSAESTTGTKEEKNDTEKSSGAAEQKSSAASASAENNSAGSGAGSTSETTKKQSSAEETKTQSGSGEVSIQSSSGAADNQTASDGTFSPAGVDNSTAAADGEYTGDAVSFTFSGGTGKTKFYCNKVIVRNGKSYAVIRTSSKSYSHFYIGTVSGSGEITGLYNPETGAAGAGVYATSQNSGSCAEVPVALGKSMPLSGRTTAMGNPHWITYTIQVSLKQDASGSGSGSGGKTDTGNPGGSGSQEGSGSQGGSTGSVKTGSLEVLPSEGMFKVAAAEIKEDGLHIYIASKSYSQMYRGTQKEAAKSAANDPNRLKAAEKDGKYEFVIPISESDGTFEIAALSAKKNAWYSRTITLDQKNMTIKTAAADVNNPAYAPVADGTGREEGLITGDLTPVSSKGMFKIVTASIEKDGLHIALHGIGYSDLYRGSQADAAKSDQNARSHYVINKDSRYEYVLPISAEDDGREFEVAALSLNNHKWYARFIKVNLSDRTIESRTASTADLAYAPVADGTGKGSQSQGGGQSGSGQGGSGQSGSGTSGGRGTGSGNTGSTGNSGSSSGSSSGQSETVRGEIGGTSGGNRVGSYTFSYSGGSGRSKISCSNITMRGNQAYATITFSRTGGGSSAYDAVRVGGQTISGSNTFTIPVNLNGNTAISARTTAMSRPYWIDFTLYVGYKEGAGNGGVVNETAGSGSGNTMIRSESKTLDEKAPEIEGLTLKEDSALTSHSDLLRIFGYENDIYLIEVNLTKRTAREDDANSASAAEGGQQNAAGDQQNTADDQQNTASDQTNADQANTDQTNTANDPADTADTQADTANSKGSTTGSAETPADEATAKLYQNEVVKYLVVPADQEIPAGLDKEAIVIRQPQDHTFVASADALNRMDQIGAAGCITAVGLKKEEIQSETVRSGLDKKDGEEGKVTEAGTYNDWDLRELVLLKNTLAVEPSEILPKNEDTEKEDLETYVKLTERAAQMDMAVFIDRAQDEENDLAKAEWYRAYGIIFNQKDNGEQQYQKAAAEASKK